MKPAFRIESDRESLARDAFALHAERSGRSLGREAGRRVVAAQYELVGGDLVERVEQSQPLAQLVTHREQELAAEAAELFGLVAQRHGGGGLRSHVEPLDRAAQDRTPVCGDLPEEPVGREVREEIFVADVYDTLF